MLLLTTLHIFLFYFYFNRVPDKSEAEFSFVDSSIIKLTTVLSSVICFFYSLEPKYYKTTYYILVDYLV